MVQRYSGLGDLIESTYKPAGRISLTDKLTGPANLIDPVIDLTDHHVFKNEIKKRGFYTVRAFIKRKTVLKYKRYFILSFYGV